MMKLGSVGITDKAISKLQARYCEQTPQDILLGRAARCNPLALVVFDPGFYGPRHVFSDRNMTKLKAVDQKSSGRCWIMAGLNLLRHASAAALNRNEDFELSGAYVMFFDKLEKSIWFLDQIWRTRHDDLDSQDVQFLLNNPISDGGQFSMFVDLVEKYGIVPAEVMPDTLHAGRTRELNDVLSSILRSFAPRLRKADELERGALAKELLAKVFRVLVLTLGCPPTSFVAHPAGKSVTPLEFYKTLEPSDLTTYVSLVSVPQDDRPMNAIFEVQGLGSVFGGRPVRYVNVALDVMYEAVIKAIDLGLRVWFGSDVNQCRHEREGLLDADAFQWKLLLGFDPYLGREDRLRYRQGAVTHAMVIVEHDADGNLFVENSWGAGTKNGYLHMTKAWFMQHVWQVVIPPKVLSVQHQALARKKNAVLLSRWDPLGVLLGQDRCCHPT